MKKKLVAIIGSGAMAIFIASAGMSYANSDNGEIHNGTIRIQKQTEAEFPSMAKITMAQAVQNALNSVTGQVLKTELEEENGFLVYGVEVVSTDKSIVDVKVDAGSGKVLAIDHDRADKEDHESGEQFDRDHED